MAMESGFIACPASGKPLSVDPVFRFGLSQQLGYPAPGTGQKCDRTSPRRANNANISWIHMEDMQFVAPKVCILADMTESGTFSPSLPGKQASLPQRNRPCSSRTKLNLINGQPAQGSVRPIHKVDVHIVEPQGSELWLMFTSTRWCLNTVFPQNFSEKSSPSAGHMARRMVLTSKSLRRE